MPADPDRSAASSTHTDADSDSGRVTDGRRARRARSREAVIDAVFELVQDGKIPPTVEQIADRSGVSVSSIFRMFEGLDDLRQRAVERFGGQYNHLIDSDVDQTADRSDRVAAFVRTRIEFYTATVPLLKMARQRALDHEPLAEAVVDSRSRLADQARQFFRTETAELTPARATNLIALIDVTTSPEAFELMSATHARSPRQIAESWHRAIDAIVDDLVD